MDAATLWRKMNDPTTPREEYMMCWTMWSQLCAEQNRMKAQYERNPPVMRVQGE